MKKKDEVIIDINDYTKTDCKDRFIDKVGNGLKTVGRGIATCAKSTVEFCAEHPIQMAIGASVVTSIVKNSTRAYMTHAEMVRRERDFYDNRAGKHVMIKRSLDPNEQVYVDTQRDLDRSYVDIFNEMNLLK